MLTPSVTAVPISGAAEWDATPGKFRLTRSGSTTSPLTVNVAPSTSFPSGVAASPADYTGLGPTVTFPAGAQTVDIDITAVDDAVPEVAEQLAVQVLSGPGYFAGGSSGPITIRDNDARLRFQMGTYFGAAKYDLPWDSVDSSQATQTLALSGLVLNISRGAEAPISYAVTSATAKFAYGHFQSVSFTATFAAPVEYSSLTIQNGGGTAVLRSSGQNVMVGVAMLPKLVIDFSPTDVPKYVNETWRVVVEMDGKTLGPISIGYVTATDTPTTLRDKVRDVLKNDFKLETEVGRLDGTKPILVVRFPELNGVKKVTIAHNVPNKPAGPKEHESLSGATDQAPTFELVATQ
ncbi:MAG: hypothetical protein K2X82_28015 [Gemmataceae bacterium]|nr:hypothetical protein [Gemmataceae bacterium]